MARLWARIIVRNRIERQATAPCTPDTTEEALTQLCRDFDIPYPIWLRKHEYEYEQFRRTSFLPEHFMESIDFQRLEIEYLDDTGKKRKSTDPRNQFDGF